MKYLFALVQVFDTNVVLDNADCQELFVIAKVVPDLTGGGQLEVAEGKVELPPGTVEYIDDLTGKGHTTANVGQEPRVSIHLEFEDQQQIIGSIAQK